MDYRVTADDTHPRCVNDDVAHITCFTLAPEAICRPESRPKAVSLLCLRVDAPPFAPKTSTAVAGGGH